MANHLQIRAARTMLGWTQSELAARAKISRRTLAAIEAGISNPFSATMGKLQSALEEGGVLFLDSDVGAGVMLRHVRK